MALPITLTAGMIAVYGPGVLNQTANGAIIPDGYRSGIVDKVWDGGEFYVYGGDSIIWKDGSEFCKVVTNGVTYTLLEKAQIATETPPT